MTDELKGAASGATASDQAGKASGAAPGAADQGAGEQEQTITLAQAKALFGQWKQETLLEASKQSQALVDKADSRITARYRAELASVERVVEAYKAAGTEMPAAVLKNLQDQAMQRAIDGGGKQDASGAQQPGQAGAGSGAPQEGGVADAVVALAIQEQDKAGIYILDADPEVALIDRTGDAQKFLASIPVAIKAKALRLAGVAAESSDDASDDEEGAAPKPGPGKGLQARGKGKAASGVKDGLTSSEYFTAGFREALGKG